MRFQHFLLTLCLAAGTSYSAVPVTGAQAERHQAALREAGVALNTSLDACRSEASRAPGASRRELKTCERTARAAFRRDVKRARALLRQRQPA